MAAAATVNKALDYIVSFNKSLADMGTLADRVGLSLKDLQGIQFGGQIAGLTESQVNAGLEKSSQLLNDAQRNANSLSKEFDANGISLRNANGQLISQNQLLQISADLVSRARNPQDATAIAQMLGFTKEWVPLLQQAPAQWRISATRRRPPAPLSTTRLLNGPQILMRSGARARWNGRST